MTHSERVAVALRRIAASPVGADTQDEGRLFREAMDLIADALAPERAAETNPWSPKVGDRVRVSEKHLSYAGSVGEVNVLGGNAIYHVGVMFPDGHALWFHAHELELLPIPAGPGPQRCKTCGYVDPQRRVMAAGLAVGLVPDPCPDCPKPAPGQAEEPKCPTCAIAEGQAQRRAEWFEWCQENVPATGGEPHDNAARRWIEQIVAALRIAEAHMRHHANCSSMQTPPDMTCNCGFRRAHGKVETALRAARAAGGGME